MFRTARQRGTYGRRYRSRPCLCVDAEQESTANVSGVLSSGTCRCRTPMRTGVSEAIHGAIQRRSLDGRKALAGAKQTSNTEWV